MFSLRLGLGLWQIHQLKQGRQSLPELWKAKASVLQQALGVRRRVEISTHETLDSPLTLGWLKPMILLPTSMLMAMPVEQLESILVHELAHIRRHDYLWNLLQSITEVILFYHPAYWYIASVLEQEREHACDAITLKITERPQVYAQALLQVASLRTTLSTVGLSARGRSGFAERIGRIVAPQQKKKGVQPLPFLLSFFLIGFLLFAFTLKSPLEEQNPDEFIADTYEVDSTALPFMDLKDGYGNIHDLGNLPATTQDSLQEIDYGSSFQEVMDGLPDTVFDTTELLMDELYSRYITIDQYLNSMHRSLQEFMSNHQKPSFINYAAPTVLYLLDDQQVDPKNVRKNEVESLSVYASGQVKDVDTTKYSLVVKARSKNQLLKETSGVNDPTEKPATQASYKTIDGRVLDAYANQGIAGVSIQAGASEAISDEKGYYQISLPNSTRKTTFNFSHPDYPDKLMEVNTVLTKRVYLSMFKEGEGLTITAPRLPKDTLHKDRSAIDNRLGLMDSSMYDVLEEKILINLKNNAVKLKADATASGDDPDRYTSISDPEVRFTLDGVVTDPRSVNRELVESTSFEMRNTANGYVLEVSAISKEAAETARKENQKTVLRGIVKDKETGKRLSGAFIFVKGTNIGNVSDLYGNYQIKVPEGNREVVFTFSGYETRTEVIQHSKILEIAMSPVLEKEVLNDKIIVNGRVLDAISGKPLVGVEVYSKENGVRIEGISTFTNQNGEYQFAVPADFKVLVYSKEGYPDHVIPIQYLTGDKTWEIVMKKQSQVNKKEKIQSPSLIQGQVIDAKTGQGIPGANVLISGTTIGTMANEGGGYLLKLTDDAQSLSFNAIGYQEQQIPIDGSAELNVILLPSETSQNPDDQDNILFIIDDVVRDDIKSFKELDEKYPVKSPYNISIKGGAIDPSMVPSMNPALLKLYNKLVIINTSNAGPKNIARGKIIDEETKKPLSGVLVTSLTEENLKTYTDENGEYELKVIEQTKHLFHTLPGYLPFLLPSKMATAFDTPIHMTLKRFDEDGFENNLKVFPNPGNDEIKVSFSLSEAASVAFKLLDKEAKLLHEVEYHYDSSGDYEVIIPSENFPPDTYFLRVSCNGESVVKGVILR